MKKSIVLLISLFFISALSALIIKNLDDTNSYIKEHNHQINRTQMIVSIKNLQNEISTIFKQHPDDIDDVLDKTKGNYIPIKIKELDILFLIQDYEKVDINTLSESDESKYKDMKTLFLNYDISNFETFKDSYIKKNIEFKNKKQVLDLIESFKIETYNDKITNIRNKIGFTKKDETSKLYELFIKINFLDEFAKAYYILDKNGGVKYFESSFK